MVRSGRSTRLPRSSRPRSCSASIQRARRARDGKLHKGHTGIARLALRTGVPIVPVGIIGSEECQRPDARLPSPFKRVHLRFGRPIDVTRYSDRADDRIVLRQITDEVMFEIANLSGQDYVDTYATKGAAMKVAPEAPESARVPEPNPNADRATYRQLDGVPQEAEVIQFPDRRSARSDPRHPATMDTPAAGYAPSAALPTRDRAASLALVGRMPMPTAWNDGPRHRYCGRAHSSASEPTVLSCEDRVNSAIAAGRNRVRATDRCPVA